MTNEYVNLLACISNVIDLIKDNSGFKDAGCYKHGLINDGEIVDRNNKTSYVFNNNIICFEVQVNNKEINYHGIKLQPTNREFLGFFPNFLERGCYILNKTRKFIDSTTLLNIQQNVFF